MLAPESLIDDFFNDDFFGRPDYSNSVRGMMRTDVVETPSTYELSVDVPGYKKEELKLELKDGYLTITATRNAADQPNQNDKYLRRERFAGNCSRTFYVGKAVSQEEIHAKFEDGVLKLSIPRKDVKAAEENKYISID